VLILLILSVLLPLLLWHEAYVMAELVEALHCKTVMSLIPEGVIGNFYLLNPLGQTMALGSTQPHYRNEY